MNYLLVKYVSEYSILNADSHVLVGRVSLAGTDFAW
jgi:hypothetical protein